MTQTEVAGGLDTIYRLRFLGPVHFGEDSSGLERSIEFLHSDTLFSAICHAWASLYGSDEVVTSLIKQSAATAPLLLSSAFIFTSNGNGDTYYLPKPKFSLRPVDRERLNGDFRLAKAFKEADFLPAELWQRWVQGQAVFINPAQEEAQLKAYKKAFVERLQPRNFVPRNRNETMPYFCSSVIYEKGCGLYFITRCSDRTVKTRLENCLDFLTDSGLGGERSSGYGNFKWKQDEHTPVELLGQPVENPEGYILLSLLSPDQTVGEADLNAWRYSLVRRRGFALPLGPVTGEVRKKNLLLLSEGSSRKGPTPPRGSIKDITPDVTNGMSHRLQRSGLALTWPYIA